MKEKIKQTLKRLEKLSNKKNGNPYWIISPETGEFLYKLVLKRNIKKILEIGTSIGYSGIWLANALRKTGGKLYTVESKKERFDMAKANFAEAGINDIVTQIFGHAPDIDVPDIIDMLFLDATKFEYKYYLSTFMFHMKKGGIIVADNAISHKNSLLDYYKMVKNSDQLRTQLKKIGSGLLISEIL